VGFGGNGRERATRGRRGGRDVDQSRICADSGVEGGCTWARGVSAQGSGAAWVNDWAAGAAPHETARCWATIACSAASVCECVSVGMAAVSVDIGVFSLLPHRLHLYLYVERGGRNGSGKRCPVTRMRCPAVGRRASRRSLTDCGEDEGRSSTRRRQ
jgi:hypothetical protein